jgi:alpha-N-acetylglucosamine transferase
VVLYTPNLDSEAIRALKLEARASNLILQQCEHLLPPKGTEINLIAERFADTWTKLRVFELFDFDAVCYLDADMAIFGDMDSVFDFDSELPEGWLAANQACVCNLDNDAWAPEDWRQENCAFTPLSHPDALVNVTQPSPSGPRTWGLLNGGMFLFRPTKRQWQAMLSEFNTSPLLSSFMFPDQDFLAHFFKERWLAIGWQYNAIKTMRYWHSQMWRDEEVICLHYIVDKPWPKRIGRDGIAGYKKRDGPTHERWWNLYHDWESRRKGTEALDILRSHVAPPLSRLD